MKKIVKLTLAAVTALTIGGTAMAQNHLEDPRYGNTPEERDANAKKLSYLKFEYDSKNWDQAAVYLKELMNDAPKSSAALYQYGTTIYKQKVARATSLEDKKRYVDSVMLIYDRRVEHVGTATAGGVPQILKLKAQDYLVLNPLERDGVRKYFKEAVDAAEGAAAPDFILLYFQQLVNDFKSVSISPEELLGEYERLAPMMEAAPEAEKDKFMGLFATSGAASCEVLEELYTGLLAGDPNNVDILTKAYNLMSMIDCQSDFYVSVAERYYAAQPSSAVAIRLASVFENRNEYEKAMQYLNEMLPAENDPMAKANLYVRIAASELGLKRGSAAAQAARAAIALNPDNGYARMFLAEAYIAGASGCSGFHAQSVFWLAYDEFSRARETFAGDASMQESITQRMNACRANFPTLEDGFMYVQDYADGKSYQVSCGWVSGSTIIRSR